MYALIEAGETKPIDIPANAVGITVSPSPDGSSTLVVAWLEQLGLPRGRRTEAPL